MVCTVKGVNYRMVEIKKMKVDEASKTIRETPKRVVGQWKQLTDELRKKGEGATVTGLTRGQLSALQRHCKDAQFEIVSINKGTGAVISPLPIKDEKSAPKKQ